MKLLCARLGIAGVVGVAIFTLAAQPAGATGYVQDQAGMFAAGTVAQLNERITNFNAQTGKEIVVITTPSLGVATLQSAAQSAFAQQNVNGVLIFIARNDRKDIIVPDRAGLAAGWFTPDVLRDVRTGMEAQFRSENYDTGIIGAVGALLGIYRAHLNEMRQPSSGLGGAPVQGRFPASQGFHISMFWWIVIIVVGFLILRSVVRAVSTPRYNGPGAPPPGAPGAAGGPGYGAGYGGFGGGGSFWSGLLGGLGGAWLGNELFRGGGGMAPGGGQTPDAGGCADAAGWQSDAGQAGIGDASSGDWSGGGFGGDSGGGTDFGGGGGDSGGGW
jgi:uncharacterized protein